MTLTVETGDGVEGADSYASLETAKSYIEDWHDPSDWNAADETARERALRQGTRFVDSHAFLGRRAKQKQGLAWPRVWVGLVDGQEVRPDEVPEAVQNAAIEAALRVIQGEDLMPDHDGGSVRRTSRKVGPITTDTEFATPRQAGKKFEAVRALLKPYLCSSPRLFAARA